MSSLPIHALFSVTQQLTEQDMDLVALCKNIFQDAHCRCWRAPAAHRSPALTHHFGKVAGKVCLQCTDRSLDIWLLQIMCTKCEHKLLETPIQWHAACSRDFTKSQCDTYNPAFPERGTLSQH
eukprot:215880-Amphidinium_carterae.2